MRRVFLLVVGLAVATGPLAGAAEPMPSLVVTQLPLGLAAERGGPLADGMLRADYGEGARIVLVDPEGRYRVLTAGFHSAADPSLSFDAHRIVFAGQEKASDPWAIYEMNADGSGVRLVTRGPGRCRSPFYMSTVYTLTPTDTEPWQQVGFIGSDLVEMNEYADVPSGSLYSCKLDGSTLRRLSFDISSELDPFLKQDGRVLFAGWQRSQLDRGPRGRIALFEINLDGADYAIFAGDQGLRIKQMPTVTSNRLAVFVEADRVGWDGAGSLAAVSLRRSLHTYRRLTTAEDGLFLFPSPLPDGEVLVSRRPADGSGSHAVYRLDPASGKRTRVFDDPEFHDIQALALLPRARPDGRSSVIRVGDPQGTFYGLDVYTNDLADPGWLSPGEVKTIRVLEGIPRRRGDGVRPGIPPLVTRRLIGEAPVQEDGSFHIQVPSDTPIELQILDADGLSLRRCSWIWARGHEPRGCIGCHEDPELSPRNHFAKALSMPAVQLTLPPERRRTVDFRRDLMPIIERRCLSCHAEGGAAPRLDGGMARAYESLLAPSDEPGSWRYVSPGQARKSPLIWHLFGRNTARPWDGDAVAAAARPVPEPGSGLTDLERRLFVEWIDLGALWDGIPGPDPLPGYHDGDQP